MTSEDVAFSVMAVKQNHPFQTMLAPVDNVETPDPHTAVLRMSRPHPAILLAMSPALMPVLPKHIYGDGQDLKSHPRNSADLVGSGPYRLRNSSPARKSCWSASTSSSCPASLTWTAWWSRSTRTPPTC